jgi:hypothetical protein
MNPASHSHPWFPIPAFAFPTPHGKQLVLSDDGSNPASHRHAKAMGSALLDMLTALATQELEQWLDPAAVALLR